MSLRPASAAAASADSDDDGPPVLPLIQEVFAHLPSRAFGVCKKKFLSVGTKTMLHKRDDIFSGNCNNCYAQHDGRRKNE